MKISLNNKKRNKEEHRSIITVGTMRTVSQSLNVDHKKAPLADIKTSEQKTKSKIFFIASHLTLYSALSFTARDSDSKCLL